MTDLHYVISGLDLLEDYPDVKEYIKNYYGTGTGNVMYTNNTHTHYNAEIEKQMEIILNANGMHSGGSWACMLLGISSVLNDTYRREFMKKFEKEKEKEKEKDLYTYKLLLNLLLIIIFIYKY